MQGVTAPHDPLAEFRAAVAPAGLLLVGAVDADAARPLRWGQPPDPLEGARTVLVVASGGTLFWERLPDDERAGRQHPIDERGQRVIGAALGALPAGARLLTQDQADAFDLRRLAALAGLGVVSPRLQLVLHPTYGPWVSVRGLVALPVALAPAAPLAWDPCGPCPAPCLDACPVGAYSRRAPFEVGRCCDHRLQETAPARHCAERCHARDACVLGREHAYGPAEMRHRHRAGLPMLGAWAATRP